jgi:biofilm PGA synthesis N-glycosyltransferase PgaC
MHILEVQVNDSAIDIVTNVFRNLLARYLALALPAGWKMFTMLLILAISAGALFSAVYCLYYFRVFKTKESQDYISLINQLIAKCTNPTDMPKVTVLIPARNEESAIRHKLRNLAELNYDKDKLDIVIVDDYSDDQTCHYSINALNRYGLRGKVVKNNHSGANAAYNTGILEAKGDFVLVTDADVTIEKDSLKKALAIITNIRNAGAVTAQSKPISDYETSATMLDKTYHSFVRAYLIAESAIYSTFPGFGGFLLLKKEALSPIPINYGSKDCNIAFSTVKKGYRYIYGPNVLFYETICEKLKVQTKQKTRRAARLVQSLLLNYDIAFKKDYGQFGKLIFPLRFLMLIVCPVLAFIAFWAIILLIFLLSTILGFLSLSIFFLAIFSGTRTHNSILHFFSSFVFHQFYLLLGLILSPKKMSVWSLRKKPISGINRAHGKKGVSDV